MRSSLLRIDFRRVEEVLVLTFSSSTCSRRDIILMALISGFWRSLPGTLRRTGCSRCSLRGRPAERISVRAYRGILRPASAELAGAFSISSGATTLARIAECGQAATQWLHSSTQRFLPDGDLFGDVAFLPAGGAHGPGAVRRQQRRPAARIAEAGQHRGW